MKKYAAVLTALMLAVAPNRLRIAILRWLGAKIGDNCFIGAGVILDARQIIIGNNVRIAPFNLMHRLERLYLGDGSRLNGFNWITGAGTGNFFLGRNSAITRLHFFEASGGIRIEENSIIAGRGTHFFTHGISSTNLDDVRPVTIGAWSYIGSSSRFVPGCSIARGTFVGMGAVVTKACKEEYVLLAGNPAVVKKTLTAGDAYFARSFLPHDHHAADYDGGNPDPQFDAT